MVRKYQDTYINKNIMKKFVSESIGNILKPKGINDVLGQIDGLSVNDKINRIKSMQTKWGEMYDNLLKSPEVLDNIRDEVRNEFDKLDIIKKVNYIEQIERDLPEIFSNMRDEETINDLKEFIIKSDFESKSKLIWRFFKSWPDLFKDIEDDPSIDEESNQLLLLYKIKGAINSDNVEKLNGFIQKLGERYGRKNLLNKAQEISIPDGFHDHSLFNKKDLEQLKLSLYQETRSEEEALRDETTNIFAFISYPDYKEVIINGRKLKEERLGIEKLVLIDKYNASSLAQVPMMKIRAQAQYGGVGGGVYGVYIPKFMWEEESQNERIPDRIREYIDKNKFKL